MLFQEVRSNKWKYLKLTTFSVTLKQTLNKWVLSSLLSYPAFIFSLKQCSVSDMFFLLFLRVQNRIVRFLNEILAACNVHVIKGTNRKTIRMWCCLAYCIFDTSDDRVPMDIKDVIIFLLFFFSIANINLQENLRHGARCV